MLGLGFYAGTSPTATRDPVKPRVQPPCPEAKTVMDGRRSAKSRPTGTEPKISNSASRPALGDRLHSDTPVSRRRQSTSKRISDSPKITKVVDRDSQASIGHDSFFRSYDSPQSVRLAEQSRKGATARIAEPPIRDAGVPQVNIAVLGARGVGKSTFVQNCLGLREPVRSRVEVQKMKVEDQVLQVRLLELSLNDVTVDEEGQIEWPSSVGDVAVPSMNGVLLLYDVTQENSSAEIADILCQSPQPQVFAVATWSFSCNIPAVQSTWNSASHSAFKVTRQGLTCDTDATKRAGTPRVLVACKCDNPPAIRQVYSGTFGDLEPRQSSSSKPESQKKCLYMVINAFRAQEQAAAAASQARSTSRPRRATTSSKDRSTTVKVSSDEPKKHVRTRSDLPQSNSRTLAKSAAPSKRSSQASKTKRESLRAGSSSSRVQSSRSSVSQPQRGPKSVQTHLSLSDEDEEEDDGASSASESDNEPQTPVTHGGVNGGGFLRPGTAETSDSQAHRTFLNMEDESDDHGSEDDSAAPSQELEKVRIAEGPGPEIAKSKSSESTGPEVGSSFDSLVDRLLSLPTTKQEEKFLPVFLCLYRKFASPGLLLSGIIDRFEQLEESNSLPQSSDQRLRSGRELTKVGEQLRYLQVLARWTAAYPGDFANPWTRAQATTFVENLEKYKPFAGAAKELRNHLAIIVLDDDTAWGVCDDFGPQPSERKPSSARLNAPLQSPKEAAAVEQNMTGSQSSLDRATNSSPRHSGAPSNTSSTTKTGNTSNQSLTPVTTLDEFRREAARLQPVPRFRLSKLQWHQFMDTLESDFAMELTRIDWILYSAIRPRDFVRHVSMKTTKSESAGLTNIGRMINHFQHVALFVTGMILLRDKPKHRAKALEKFMAIAWKCRQLNNYNSLGCILAAINGVAIHRLVQTKELLPERVQKDFRRLEILMGTSRSHAAYRLAWENSFAERIPFMTLVLKDLNIAEDCNRTFVKPSGHINWKKFEIMGEVILSIQKSQEKPYGHLPKNHEVKNLLLETKVLEHEEDSFDPGNELYDRSVQLEPGAGGDAARKKLDWFRR